MSENEELKSTEAQETAEEKELEQPEVVPHGADEEDLPWAVCGANNS